MQLYFIRHGQSANNALRAATGREEGRSFDPPLTELGRRQAQRLADSLAHEPPADEAGGLDPQNRAGFGLTQLYASLMLRSVATGEILAARLGVPLRAWAVWHEVGGLYLDDPATGGPVGRAGPNRAYFEEHHPRLELGADVGEAGWWNRPFEPEAERSARAGRALAALMARHGGTEDRVAVVSHGGFYQVVIGALLGCDGRQPAATVLNNCAVSRIDFVEERAYLVYSNRAEHLPAGLITQ